MHAMLIFWAVFAVGAVIAEPYVVGKDHQSLADDRSVAPPMVSLWITRRCTFWARVDPVVDFDRRRVDPVVFFSSCQPLPIAQRVEIIDESSQQG